MSHLDSHPSTSVSPSVSIAGDNHLQIPNSGSVSGIAVDVPAENSLSCHICKSSSVCSECMDCSMLLCEACVRAHQRAETAQDHTIVRISNIPKSLSPSAIVGSLAQGIDYPEVGLCGNHQEPFRVFCNTCFLPLCSDCLISSHTEHQTMYIEELFEVTKVANDRLCKEVMNAITTVGEAIENVRKMADSVESKSIRTVSEVKRFVDRCIIELKKRELDLIKLIDHARQIKGKHLTSQMDNLRIMFTKIGCSFGTMHQSPDCNNIYDMMIINDKLTDELKYIRTLSPMLLPCDDDNIKFVPPEKNFMRAISSIGTVIPNFQQSSIPAIWRNQPAGEFKIEELFPPMENCCIYGADKIKFTRNLSLPIITFGEEAINRETNNGELSRPWGVCSDHMGNIIVADRSNDRIQIFNYQGKFLYKFGSPGAAPGQFNRPAGITISPKGHIVVADKDNHRIQIFEINGQFVQTFGEMGNRNGQFQYPWDVACNGDGNIVVTDARNHRIQLFTEKGIFLNKFGFEGLMVKQFESPRGICFHPRGDIIVSDFNNHRLAIIDPYLKNINYLGQEGNGFVQFFRPQGIICDDEGNIIVADSRNNRIQILTMQGNLIDVVGKAGKNVGELDRPCGICLNPEGRIVVVDFGNNRVQIF